MKFVTIAGLRVAAEKKPDVLSYIQQRMRAGQVTVVSTVYSEFLYAALQNHSVMDTLNRADVAVADGVGVVWAHEFLSAPLAARNKVIRCLVAFWQMVRTGASILLFPRTIYKTIPEKIVGADLSWDLGALAAQEGVSVFLLGGHDNVPEVVAKKLQARFPNLTIAGASNADYPGTEELLQKIRESGAAMLFVAWGPIRQERWIIENIKRLPNVKLAIGLGGTFDYIAGRRSAPPQVIRSIGLEWLFRLLTQPHRLPRIYRATFGLVWELIRYKATNA
jgi:N-acetylglucosaminyldiphosphoundecaprenol N-acetyl-beta-D-mannosaminyltransferase